MSCCHLSRRQLLRWSALVGSTALLPVLDPERSYASARSARTAAGGLLLAMNLELVTLTETSAVVTWYTAAPGMPGAGGKLPAMPAGTTVMVGTSPLTMQTVIDRQDDTPYHYAELTGLEPGQTYFYLASSDGVPALPATFAEGNPAGSATVTGPSATALYTFTTPQPPPGKFLFSMALCNDLHLGETVAGLAYSNGSLPGGGIPPGFTTPAGEPPYSQTMAKALVADSRARGVDVLIAAGDVSSGAEKDNLAEAKAILDGFGSYNAEYFVARGNHDRAMQDSTCSPTTCEPSRFGVPYYDRFRDEFYPGTADVATWASHEKNGLRLITLDTYDKTGNGGDNGMLGAEQYAWLTGELAKDPDRPTLVFGHHPVSLESTLTTTEPVIFDLDVAQGRQLESMYAATPGVFFHHSGHTHRNKRSVGTTATGVTFQEVAATKEYPGGFSLLRVHEGGYAVNFYKTRSDLAREWSETTRQEDFSVGPFYVLGSVSDRNYVVTRDLSGLSASGSTSPAAGAGVSATGSRPVEHPARHRAKHRERVEAGRTPVAGRAPAQPTRTLAFTGPDVAVPVTAAGLLAAAAVIRRTGKSSDR